ncbi:MAG TPA: DUF6011 domain-containing protein [Hyphomicrobium sp.]|nr:DUF6011 domain-containing protein [Hyphomicrobium sp.]
MLTPHEQKVEALRANVEKLPERDRGFANSLVDSYDEKGQLTDKQFVWIEKLLERTAPAKAAEVAKEQALLKPIVDLLTNADLKKPSVRFVFADGTLGKVYLASATGSNAGHVYVKDGSQYAGKITPEGAFRPVDLSDDRKAELIAVLTSVAEDPFAAAKLFADATKSEDREHGSCCFCAHELTDPRSIAVSYGPICAAKYHLPWGEASANEEAA